MNGLRLICLLLFLAGPWAAENVRALDTITDLKIVNGVATVQFASNPGIYYLLEYSEDLSRWQPVDATLGIRSVLDLEEAARRGFFRAQPNSVFAPLDMDGDGIDDVYELNHPDILDPLDPTDGSKIAPGGDGKTNYQIYLSLFGIKSHKILQRESREWSLFNFGSGDPFESISREQSLFNFGSPSATLEANGREVSLYNGQTVPVSDLLQIEGREVSLFNFGGAAPSQPGGPPNRDRAVPPPETSPPGTSKSPSAWSLLSNALSRSQRVFPGHSGVLMQKLMMVSRVAQTEDPAAIRQLRSGWQMTPGFHSGRAYPSG